MKTRTLNGMGSTTEETLGHDLGRIVARGFIVVILRLRSCDARAIQEPA